MFFELILILIFWFNFCLIFLILILILIFFDFKFDFGIDFFKGLFFQFLMLGGYSPLSFFGSNCSSTGVWTNPFPWRRVPTTLETGHWTLGEGAMHSNGRGGARHFPKPMVETGLLFDVLSAHEKIIADFKQYETLSTGSSIDPKGLMYCLQLVASILEFEPSCELHPQPLRNGLLRLLTNKPALNASMYSGSIWVNQRAQRVNVVLSHFRKLARAWPNAKCAGELTGKEVSQLPDILQKIELRDAPLQKGPLPLENGNAREDPDPPQKKLKKEDTEISLDSDGFPMELKSPQASPSKTGPCRLLKGSIVVAKVHKKEPETNTTLRDAMGLGSSSDKPLNKGAKKKPAAAEKVSKKPAAKPLKKGKKKPSAVEKASAGAAEEECDPGDGPWCKINRTNATKPQPRSYLCGIKEPGAKPKHIVEVTQTMSKQYHLIITLIKNALEKGKSMNKAKARKMRDDLCKKYTWESGGPLQRHLGKWWAFAKGCLDLWERVLWAQFWAQTLVKGWSS